MEKGYGFDWPSYSKLSMVRPGGEILPHDAEDYLPYLPEPDSISVAISEKPPIGLPGIAKRACPGAATPEGSPSGSAEESLTV